MAKDSDGFVRAIARGFSVVEALGRYRPGWLRAAALIASAKRLPLGLHCNPKARTL